MTKKKAECIRQVANWSHMEATHKFDKATFRKEKVKEDMALAAPKMKALFENIAKLDAKDRERYGHTFKHIVFSDVKTFGYGAKILMAGFLAEGFNAVYDKSFTLDEQKLRDHPGKNVAVLCSTTVYDKPMSVRFRKQLLELFNRRPENVHGELIRFIILDPGFKEGIDIFDVKYVHLYEPLLTRGDEKQAVGRGTRFCGQKGLTFQPQRGWPLHVFRYDVEIPEEVPIDSKTLFDLYVQQTGVDVRRLVMANQLEEVVKEAAVDAELTSAIHEFQPGKTLMPRPPREPRDPSTYRRPTLLDKALKVKKPKIKAATAGGAKKKRRLLPPKPPQTKKKWMELRGYIEERFGKFRWEVKKMENLCAIQEGGVPNIVEFTPSQEFVRHYFQPLSTYKGLLLYHGTGVGKTCTAIATATSQWEPRGYTILWVTRHTLKADIWKNMFDQVCSLVIKQQLKKGEITLPKDAAAHPSKYLSQQWLMPISYKQFSNACMGKNDLYHTLVKRNGAEDPLRKTLIILDEAHKLYATDVTGAEKPNVEAIRKAIWDSYEKSGDNSVRILLMSATPYTSDPMDMIRLMNIMRERGDILPESFEEFAQRYLDESGRFSPEGRALFRDDIAGYVSYLNREQDARQFAVPIYETITVPMSRSTALIKQGQLGSVESELVMLKEQLKEGKEALKVAKKKVKEETKEKQDKECKPKPVKERKACKDAIAQHMEEFKNRLLGELESKIVATNVRVDDLKEQKKALKKKVSSKEDVSQELALFTRCGVRKS